MKHRHDDDRRFFTTLTSFGTPHDVTLQELRIESFFPADKETELSLRGIANETPRSAARIPIEVSR
jgi:hypothetical protein